MRSFSKGTHTARRTQRTHDEGGTPEPRGAHSAPSAGAAGADSPQVAHADAVTRTSSFETADARAAAAARGAHTKASACAAHEHEGAAAKDKAAHISSAERKAERKHASKDTAAKDKGKAAAVAAAGAAGAATAVAASAAPGAEESAPVTFGGRFLLSLRLHMGRRERVEVVRQKNQRRSSFSLTRTVAAVALLVLCLVSTGSTMAYLTYTANAAVNRTTSGAVYIEVTETTSTGTKSFHSGTYTADGGVDGKQVSITNPEGDDRVPSVVRISIVPEVEALDSSGSASGANQFMSETWTAPTTDDDGNQILKGEIVTVYLARGWADNWTYSDGAFYYKKVLKPGETTAQLMSGITMTDGQNSADYGSIKVNVFADALQSTPSSVTDPTEGAPGAWNCTVAADGTVTKMTS